MSSSSRVGRLRFMLAAAWHTDPLKSALIVVFVAAESVASGAVTLGLKLIIDSVASGDRSGLRNGAIIATAAEVFFLFGGRSRGILQELVAQRLAVRVDEDILTLVAGIPGIEHHENPNYVDRLKLTMGQGGVIASAAWAAIDAFAVSARLVISLWLLVSVHPALAMLPLFAVPSMLLAPRAQHRVQRARELSVSHERAEEHLHRLFLDPATAKEVRTFGASKVLDADARGLHQHVTATLLRGHLGAGVLQSLGWLIFGSGYLVALALTAFQVETGTGTAGDFVLLIQLGAQLRGQVSGAVGQVSSLSGALATVARTAWLDDYAANAAEAAGTRTAPSQLRDGIDMRGVSFRYPGTDRDVLADIDLHIKPGTTIALVGENGAGKTSLVKLLCGFYRPTDGIITVDGIDLAELDPASWRGRLSGCFQDFAHLEFHARETIGVGYLDRVDDDEWIRQAAARADALSVIDALESGLDTQLGRTHWHGAELSGGQWQRLALARAMMPEQPLVLVLDEPTAALDAPTEHELFERYAGAARSAANRQGAITVLVSHRFSTVRMADLIIVVDDGRIVERGTHDELVNAAGLYATLYNIQARAYR